MFDSHYYPEHWGVRPILFWINGVGIPSYSTFVLLGLVAGLIFYIVDSKSKKSFNENAVYIVASALIFGTLGSKIPIWIENFNFIKNHVWDNPEILLGGRTVVGGLIGGFLGVLLVKKILKIDVKLGNHIAPAAALGIAIGRIGCFLRGCCYGIPTGTAFGVDFGDGIPRHPTELYEAVFDFGLFLFLLHLRKRVTEPGKLFRIFLSIYFSFRFIIEFIRIEPKFFLGLTWYQLASLLIIAFVNRRYIIKNKRTVQEI